MLFYFIHNPFFKTFFLYILFLKTDCAFFNNQDSGNYCSMNAQSHCFYQTENYSLQSYFLGLASFPYWTSLYPDSNAIAKQMIFFCGVVGLIFIGKKIIAMYYYAQEDETKSLPKQSKEDETKSLPDKQNQKNKTSLQKEPIDHAVISNDRVNLLWDSDISRPRCTNEIAVYSNSAKTIVKFNDQSITDAAANDYLVKQVLDTTVDSHRGNSFLGFLNVKEGGACFFNIQLWSVRKYDNGERRIRFCDDIEKIETFFDFAHSYSLYDDYPNNLFSFNGPNNNKKAVLAINQLNNGELLLLDLHQKYFNEKGFKSTGSHLSHILKSKITAAALQGSDNNVVCATLDGNVSILRWESNNTMTKVSTLKTDYYIKSIIWASSEYWYGLNQQGNIVKGLHTNDTNGTKDEITYLLKEHVFDYIAVDQQYAVKQGLPSEYFINIACIKSDGVMYLYTPRDGQLEGIMKVDNYKKERITRFTLVGNQISLLTNRPFESSSEEVTCEPAAYYNHHKLFVYELRS